VSEVETLRAEVARLEARVADLSEFMGNMFLILGEAAVHDGALDETMEQTARRIVQEHIRRSTSRLGSASGSNES